MDAGLCDDLVGSDHRAIRCKLWLCARLKKNVDTRAKLIRLECSYLAVKDASYRSGPGDRLAVRPALGYSVQPVHWTGSLALITLVFTVQPVQVAQSHNTTHHTPLHHCCSP